jgi:hypothetical protein
MRVRFLIKSIINPIITLKSFNRDYWKIGLHNKDNEIRYMNTWNYGKLERQNVNVIFPGIENISYTVLNAFKGTFNMSLTLTEINILCAIVKHLKPMRVLEIGTFDGGATLNIAANTPDNCLIYTVDLPVDFKSYDLDIKLFYDNTSPGDKIGEQFNNTIYAAKIKQILCDSAVLDYDALNGNFNIIFIDGCHDSHYVKYDSEMALKHLENGGVIIWHDYGMIEPVSKYIDELSLKRNICAIAGTRLAVGLF